MKTRRALPGGSWAARGHCCRQFQCIAQADRSRRKTDFHSPGRDDARSTGRHFHHEGKFAFRLPPVVVEGQDTLHADSTFLIGKHEGFTEAGVRPVHGVFPHTGKAHLHITVGDVIALLVFRVRAPTAREQSARTDRHLFASTQQHVSGRKAERLEHRAHHTADLGAGDELESAVNNDAAAKIVSDRLAKFARQLRADKHRAVEPGDMADDTVFELCALQEGKYAGRRRQFSGREEHGPKTRDTDAAKPGNTKITAIDAESRPIGVAQFRFGCGVGVASDTSFEVIPDAIPERRNHFLERRVRTRLS